MWQSTTLLALEIVYFIRHGEPSYKKISQGEHKKAKKAKEFVIVKFNAWEFSDSEELWAGLIKGIYTEVEERMSKEKDSFGVTWKEIWRLKKSFEFLVETYGEQSFYLHCLSVILISIVFVIQVFFFTIPELNDKAFDKDDYLTLFLNAASGFTSIKILSGIISVSCKKLFTSIGEAIVQESKSISDRTGFLSSVKKGAFRVVRVHQRRLLQRDRRESVAGAHRRRLGSGVRREECQDVRSNAARAERARSSGIHLPGH